MTIWCETRVGINKKWEFEFFSFLQMISTLWSFLYICGMASPFHLCSTSALQLYVQASYRSNTSDTPVVALMYQCLFSTATLFISVYLHEWTFDVEIPRYLFFFIFCCLSQKTYLHVPSVFLPLHTIVCLLFTPTQAIQAFSLWCTVLVVKAAECQSLTKVLFCVKLHISAQGTQGGTFFLKSGSMVYCLYSLHSYLFSTAH